MILSAMRKLSVDEWIVELEGMYENVWSCLWVCKGLSDVFEVKFSVHQGSVLSPLLFIIMLNALSSDIRRFQLTWNRASLSAFTRKGNPAIVRVSIYRFF